MPAHPVHGRHLIAEELVVEQDQQAVAEHLLPVRQVPRVQPAAEPPPADQARDDSGDCPSTSHRPGTPRRTDRGRAAGPTGRTSTRRRPVARAPAGRRRSGRAGVRRRARAPCGSAVEVPGCGLEQYRRRSGLGEERAAYSLSGGSGSPYFSGSKKWVSLTLDGSISGWVASAWKSDVVPALFTPAITALGRCDRTTPPVRRGDLATPPARWSAPAHG